MTPSPRSKADRLPRVSSRIADALVPTTGFLGRLTDAMAESRRQRARHEIRRFLPSVD